MPQIRQGWSLTKVQVGAWHIPVGIMILVLLYGTGVVLDGNSFKWQNSDQALKMMKNKRFAGAQFKRCRPAGTPTKRREHTCRCLVQKVRSPNSLTPMQRSALTWGFLCLACGNQPVDHDPMVLVRGIDSKLLSPRFLGPLY